MILSKKNKFIYIRTRKVSSSTFEAVVSECLGENDIITKNTDIELFKKKFNFITARNYKYTNKIRLLKKIINNSYYNFKNYIKLISHHQKIKNLPWYPYEFYDHISLERVKSRIKREYFDNFTKFIISRNPVDQLKSFYFWSSKNKSLSFDEYVEKYSKDFFLKDLELYTINGKVMIDKILIYEDMKNEIEKMLNFFNAKPNNIVKNYLNLKLKKNSKNLEISNFAKMIIYKNANIQFDLRESKIYRF